MKEKKLGKFDEWEVENAFSDIQRAEKHKANEALMKEVYKLAKVKVKEIRSISDLRNAANAAGVEEEK